MVQALGCEGSAELALACRTPQEYDHHARYLKRKLAPEVVFHQRRVISIPVLTESRTTIAGDPLYIENGFVARVRAVRVVYWSAFTSITACLELFHQHVIFILSCKPISYCRFKRIDVYIL